MKTNFNKIISIVVSIIVLVGCTSNKVLTIDGAKYTLVRHSHTNSNGIVDAALYEKEGVSDKYYTPSITGTYMITLAK